MRLQLLLIYISIIVFAIPTLYAPSLVDIGIFFDVPSTEVKRTATFYQMGVLLSSIVVGLFSDYLGKKNLLLFSLCITALGSLIAALAPSIDMLAIARFIQGAGANTGVLLGFALIVQIFDQKTSVRVFALLGLISGISLASAPLLGELLTLNFGWRAVSVVFFMISVFLIAEAYFVLDKNLNKIDKAKTNFPLKSFYSLLQNRRYLSYVMVVPALVGGIWFSFSFMPFYLEQHLGYDGSYFGILVATMMLCYGIGNYVPRLLEDKYSDDTIILMGINLSGASLILILASIIFNLAPGLMTSAALIIFAIGFGIVSPGSIAIAMSANLNLAIKSAALRALIMAIINYLSTAAAELSDDSNIWYLLVFLVISYLASILFFLFRGARKQNQD